MFKHLLQASFFPVGEAFFAVFSLSFNPSYSYLYSQALVALISIVAQLGT